MKKKLDAFKNWLIDKLGGYTVEEVRSRIEWRDRRMNEQRKQLREMREKVKELAGKLSTI